MYRVESKYKNPDRFIERLRAEVERRSPGWTPRHENAASSTVRTKEERERQRIDDQERIRQFNAEQADRVARGLPTKVSPQLSDMVDKIRFRLNLFDDLATQAKEIERLRNGVRCVLVRMINDGYHYPNDELITLCQVANVPFEHEDGRGLSPDELLAALKEGE
jgi:hypothetical protein